MTQVDMITRVDFARSCLVSIIVLFSTLSCAGPILVAKVANVSQLEIENWHELRSADFVLYSRESEQNLEAFAVDLARYIAVVERLINSQPPKIPAQLFLVEDRARELFIPRRNVAGYVKHSLGGFSSFMLGSTSHPDHRNLLLHEFTHYLHLRNSKLSYPNWYREGFAEFLGSIRTRDDMMEIGSAPPWNLAWLEDRRARKEEIDLEEIFSFERDGRSPDPAGFYPISWAVVHYLSSNADRLERMVSMLGHQAAGLHWKRAYARSFSEPIEILSEKVGRHVEFLSRGTPSAVVYLPLDELEIRDDWTIREMPANEMLRLLATAALRGVVYLRHGGTKAEMRLAQALFERACKLDPQDSTARAGLAAALSAQSKFTRAEVQLAAFREDPDPSAEAMVHAGDAIRTYAVSLHEARDATEYRRRHASAIRLYRRALESQPENAFALAGLGYSQLATQDFEAARKSLAQAETVGEWDANLALSQGRVEERLGFFAEARSFWNKVIRLGTKDEAKRAAALLDQARSKR